MGPAGEIESELDLQTEVQVLNGISENIRPMDETIITVQENEKIILVHQPASKTVSLGRSRQNDIRLEDPRFPRKAAEVILGPVPLLRKTGNTGQKSHEIVPISTGIPFKIWPYTLCLLKPGDVFVNRRNSVTGWKTSRRRPLAFILAAMLVGLLTFNFRMALWLDNPKPEKLANLNTENIDMPKTGRTSKTVSPVRKKIKILSENAPDTAGEMENNGPETRKAEEISNAKGHLPLGSPEKKQMEFADRVTVAHKMPGIPPKDLETLITAARRLFDLGKPEQAGRTITPVLPYLSPDQESHLVQSLEPGMRCLYRKAYMLRGYDRPASNAVLDQIVRSGLKVLPTFEKAKVLYDSEKRVAAAIRKTGTLPEKPE